MSVSLSCLVTLITKKGEGTDPEGREDSERERVKRKKRKGKKNMLNECASGTHLQRKAEANGFITNRKG